MKSPFKFLDAYTPEDRAVFFGRDQEVETLYQLVFKSKLLLVYGQSGTGKTSLVQCGLGGRFDLTDWYPFSIRRNENINQSLIEILSEPAGGKLRKESLTETIAYIYKNYLRPIYLIFDQFEELFILGSKEEQTIFINSIKEILEADLPCKMLLVMREEYIAQLYAFEQSIPSLFDRRLRVEPMNYANVAKVISGSCLQFNISLEDSIHNTTQIIDNISGGKSGIQLPYLQVYLDRLWQDDYIRTYPHGLPLSEVKNYPPLEFTTEEINELGVIEEVLDKFLQDQRRSIQQELSIKFQDIPVEATQQILDVFVTEEGTKRPILYNRLRGEIQLENRLKKQFPILQSDIVTEIISALERARILRITESQIELAHDSLADLIDRERSSEQRQLNQVKRRISAAYTEHKVTGFFLSSRQITSMEEYIPRIKLEPHLHTFIELCYADILAKEEVEEARVKRELQLANDKLATEKEARKRQKLFSGIIGLALIVALVAAIVAWQQQQTLIAQREQIEEERDNAKNNLKQFLIERNKNDSLEAGKIENEINDIISRANILKDRGHTRPHRLMLEEAIKLFDGNWNKSLQKRKEEVIHMLQESKKLKN